MLNIKERQIKSTMKYDFTSVKMANIKKTGNTTLGRVCGATGTLLH